MKNKSVKTKEREEAEDALFDIIESEFDPCGQWELACWLVSVLRPKAIKDLAKLRRNLTKANNNLQP